MDITIRISSQLTPGIIFPFFSFQKHKQKVYSLNKLTHTNVSIINEAALELYCPKIKDSIH